MHLSTHELAGNAHRVGIGECRLGGDGDALRATLGSCVGVCLVYPQRRQFTLAHVLLPFAPDDLERGDATASRYADTVVQHLLDLMKVQPAERRRLRAYVAGGASMFENAGQLNRVGDENQLALVASLKALQVRVAEEDFGGDEGRQLVVHGPKGVIVSLHLEDPQASLVWDFPAAYRVAGDRKS